MFKHFYHLDLLFLVLTLHISHFLFMQLHQLLPFFIKFVPCWRIPFQLDPSYTSRQRLTNSEGDSKKGGINLTCKNWQIYFSLIKINKFTKCLGMYTAHICHLRVFSLFSLAFGLNICYISTTLYVWMTMQSPSDSMVLQLCSSSAHFL